MSDTKRWYILTIDEKPLDQVDTWDKVEGQALALTEWGSPSLALQVWDVDDEKAILHHIVPWGSWTPSDPLPDTPQESHEQVTT